MTLHEEVARMKAKGFTNKEIIRKYNIRETTLRAIILRNQKAGIRIKLSKAAEQRLLFNAMREFEKPDRIRSRFYQPSIFIENQTL